MRPCWVILAVYVFVLLLAVLPDSSRGQLTQSLGWGSAGSPGKRGGGLGSVADIGCEFDPLILRDIMYLIQVRLWSFFKIFWRT